MEPSTLIIIVIAWMIAAGSPGPATLAISSVAMGQGRKAGVTIASGITLGSITWGIAAAAGISSIMIANAWIFEVLRYVGAAYLLFLALKSLKSAFHPVASKRVQVNGKRLFAKGMLIHLTNPKAVLSWGSIFAIALPADAGLVMVLQLLIILIIASATVFIGYGFLFSMAPFSAAYQKLKRWFDLAFALFFGGVSLRLLTSRIEV